MLQFFKTGIHELLHFIIGRMSALTILIFFTFLLSDSSAQEGMMKGTVKSGEIVLQGATVSAGKQNTLTNSDGEFSITLKPGSYTIIISHAGYQKIEQLIDIKTGETKFLLFNMTRNEQLNEVVILGSRSSIERSNLNTPVPADRISSAQLKQTGQPSLIQMLNFTVPSFYSSRQHLTDPVTLRGLSPDHVLILLNGSRYHNPAGINSGGIRGTLGRGSVGNDLNSIPFSAIEKIEILRDGASSQYGSDAIAGVMNIELKKTTGKTFISLHTGQHYKGDGENILFGINYGIGLGKSMSAGKDGFLNFSGDLRYRKPTNRGGTYNGTVYYPIPPNAPATVRDNIITLDNQKISERNFSRQTPVSNDGSVEVSSVGFLINGVYPVNSKVDLFCTGSISYRQPFVRGAYRFPKNTNQVNSVLYPDGFKPNIISNNWDITGIAGARGVSDKGWRWELSGAYGKHYVNTFLKNTNNASQLPWTTKSQTSFNGGSALYSQYIYALGFARDFAKKTGCVKTFNVAVGTEYRFEHYRTKEGEESSWKNYDISLQTQGGAQPSPGRGPLDIVHEHRNVAGLYVDLESDITDHILINMSGRYEYYNGFGDNLSGKMAMRYKISPALSLRGSVNNGYHAPALQQIYYTSTGSTGKNVGGVNIPVRIGTFSNNSIVTKAFGIQPLQPEKSVNVSSGFTSRVVPNINITVDAYWIQIKNRIVLSGVFDKKNPVVNSLLLALPEIDQVQFVTNAINTRTHGIDIVMNSKWNIRNSILELMLAANFSETNIYGPVQIAGKLPADSVNSNTLFNREEKEKIEKGQPGSKIILSANYKTGMFGFLFRSTRFGKTSAVYNSAVKSQDEFFSAKILSDFNFSFSPKSWINITVGANNIFNVYPDRLKNYLNTTDGILIYGNEAMPFGYNGGYYFVGMEFKF